MEDLSSSQYYTPALASPPSRVRHLRPASTVTLASDGSSHGTTSNCRPADPHQGRLPPPCLLSVTPPPTRRVGPAAPIPWRRSPSTSSGASASRQVKSTQEVV